MATKLKSKVLRFKRVQEPIKPNRSAKIWQEFTCTFTQSPTVDEKRTKKAAFKANIKAFLKRHGHDKKFSIGVHWIKTNNPLVYRVLVFIWQNNPPPGPPVTTPMPAPSAPPAL